MSECEACQENETVWGNLCRLCADLAFSDVEGSSAIAGIISARRNPLANDNPWA
jgi:hypothetical protein